VEDGKEEGEMRRKCTSEEGLNSTLSEYFLLYGNSGTPR